MARQPKSPLIETALQLWQLVRVLAHLGWTAVRRIVIGALEVAAALIVMFEEWGWKPLSDALAWLARFRVIAAIEAWVARLPPYPALLLFALPGAILLPVKFAALWLLAGGHVVSATLLFAVAKIVSTAIVARIFLLVRPALLTIPWFRRAYEVFMPWKTYMVERIRRSWVWRAGRIAARRVRSEVRTAWARWRPLIVDAIRGVRGRAAAVFAKVRAALAGVWRKDAL
ncbi:MAG: hypothetical protein NW216_08515 [Hyphomicrobium sp.]|nr:hypothetical protein [Hyphomicrobium sp.]